MSNSANYMVPGIELNLGGTVYTVPPLSLGAMEKMNKQLTTAEGTSVETVIDAATAALQRNYPDMTRDTVAELLDLSVMGEVMGAVMDVGGVKRKAQAAGTT